MKPFVRWVIFLPCLAVSCWLGMLLVHECGHVLAAVATGGTVRRVELPLVGFSRTDVDPNPHPLPEIWAGPLVGGLLPLLLAMVLRGLAIRSLVTELFAGFCLLANGAYLAVGSLQRVGDTGDLLRNGVAWPILWLVGGLFMAGGLWQWHRLGSPATRVAIRQADLVAVATGAVLLVAISLLLSYALFPAK